MRLSRRRGNVVGTPGLPEQLSTRIVELPLCLRNDVARTYTLHRPQYDHLTTSGLVVATSPRPTVLLGQRALSAIMGTHRALSGLRGPFRCSESSTQHFHTNITPVGVAWKEPTSKCIRLRPPPPPITKSADASASGCPLIASEETFWAPVGLTERLKGPSELMKELSHCTPGLNRGGGGGTGVVESPRVVLSMCIAISRRRLLICNMICQTNSCTQVNQSMLIQNMGSILWWRWMPLGKLRVKKHPMLIAIRQRKRRGRVTQWRYASVEKMNQQNVRVSLPPLCLHRMAGAHYHFHCLSTVLGSSSVNICYFNYNCSFTKLISIIYWFGISTSKSIRKCICYAYVWWHT